MEETKSAAASLFYMWANIKIESQRRRKGILLFWHNILFHRICHRFVTFVHSSRFSLVLSPSLSVSLSTFGCCCSFSLLFLTLIFSGVFFFQTVSFIHSLYYWLSNFRMCSFILAAYTTLVRCFSRDFFAGIAALHRFYLPRIVYAQCMLRTCIYIYSSLTRSLALACALSLSLALSLSCLLKKKKTKCLNKHYHSTHSFRVHSYVNFSLGFYSFCLGYVWWGKNGIYSIFILALFCMYLCAASYLALF